MKMSKHMKRIFVIFSVLALIFSTTTVAFAADSNPMIRANVQMVS